MRMKGNRIHGNLFRHVNNAHVRSRKDPQLVTYLTP